MAASCVYFHLKAEAVRTGYSKERCNALDRKHPEYGSNSTFSKIIMCYHSTESKINQSYPLPLKHCEVSLK